MNYISYLARVAEKMDIGRLLMTNKKKRRRYKLYNLFVITINTKSRIRVRILNRPLVVDDLKDNNEDLSYTGFFISNINFNSMIIYQLIIHT